MSRRSWVTSSLARRPEIFCCVFRGRTPLSLMLFVGQMLVSSVNRSTSLRRSRQNSSSSRPGFCFVLFFGPGTRGTLARPEEDGVPELVLQRLAHIGGNGVQALLAGGVPGTDQAAQRP